MEGYIFDYRLGYVRDGCDLAGFDIFGSDDAPDGRLVVLGGYTTPEQAQNHKTWAESLYVRLGGKCQVLSGCTDGYTSAQILTMFIREVILFKPKLVICLSGFYNIAYKLGLVKNRVDAEILRTHPFVTPGQMAYFRMFTSRLGLGNDEVYYGEKIGLSASEYWHKQMEMLHCICDEFDIKLISFLQPCVFSGKYRHSQRENEMLKEQYNITDGEINSIKNDFQKEYENMLEISSSAGYIIDISTLFDDTYDIYIDACHLKDEYIPELTDVICSYVKAGELAL